MAFIHETAFTATGNSPYGFQTHPEATGINAGAVLFGNVSGVHATGGSSFGVRGDGKWGVFGYGKESGVMGVNYGNYGAGIHGVHSGGQGISGDSPRNHLSFAEPGTGVYGRSDEGYGGAFMSEDRAQIRLVPKLKTLPAEGK